MHQWTAEVRNQAQRHWGIGELPYDGPVMLTITYFYDDVPIDVDNIPKPILDALNRLAYNDDSQVTDILCRKRDLANRLRLENPSLVLGRTFNRQEQFVHILIEEAQPLEVIF